MKKKIILITGASKGIGKICMEYLARKGYKVYGTSRGGPKQSASILKNNSSMIQLDVNHPDSIDQAIKFIMQQEKRIDVLVNNAGIHIAGSIEETPIEKAKEQIETNFFGIHRLCQKILPIMRSQKSGYIINMSSIMGRIALPYQGFYSAAKFALEGYTEALRIEVTPFDIQVCCIEPGDMHIEPPHERWNTPITSSSPYYESYHRVMEIVEHDEANGESPIKIAQMIENIINTSSIKPRYRIGSFIQRFAAMLKGTVSDRFIEWILIKIYKVR